MQCLRNAFKRSAGDTLSPLQYSSLKTGELFGQLFELSSSEQLYFRQIVDFRLAACFQTAGLYCLIKQDKSCRTRRKYS